MHASLQKELRRRAKKLLLQKFRTGTSAEAKFAAQVLREKFGYDIVVAFTREQVYAKLTSGAYADEIRKQVRTWMQQGCYPEAVEQIDAQGIIAAANDSDVDWVSVFGHSLAVALAVASLLRFWSDAPRIKSGRGHRSG